MTTYPEHVARAPQLDVVEFVPPPDSEAVALRMALTRMYQDNYALQKALERTQTERDFWRTKYNERETP